MMKLNYTIRPIAAITSLLLLCGCSASQAGTIYEPTVESLRQYRCPEWFRDAKFGIYCHWNAQSASKSPNNGWYARDLYEEGSSSYKDHLKNWGHPSRVGYKDVIEAWNGDRFDAAEWVRLFQDAGAKYILTMAVHHDNFDMWDSAYQPKWNSLHYGPRKDVCAEMRRETLKAGLRWGVTTHLERTYSWFQTNKGADQQGSMKGIPYDGNDPKYQDLYLPVPDFSTLGDPQDQLRHPLASPGSWKQLWKNRMFDLIDRYHPDHLYFDGAVPFMDDQGQTGLEVIAHYYNHNASRHRGVNEGVMVIKDITRHGFYYPGISSIVMERTKTEDITAQPRQVENSIGPWFHTGDTQSYSSSQSLLHEMIDTVSKNNNYLLNIPPQADGSFDESAKRILKDFGGWLRINGDAIYKTRPWHTFGEDNLRFTTRGRILYAIALNDPGSGFTIRSAKGWRPEDIKKIELLGGGEVSWKLTEKGLEISCPGCSGRLAYAFKITSSKDAADLPFEENTSTLSVEEANRRAAWQYGADGNGGQPLPGQ